MVLPSRVQKVMSKTTRCGTTKGLRGIHGDRLSWINFCTAFLKYLYSSRNGHNVNTSTEQS